MLEPFLGMIATFGFDWAPKGWVLCTGQLLPINQYQALFSLLGTQYGGNGTTNFALPDLRSRVPIGAGQGNGLPPYTQGTALGAERVTLNITNMSSHSHTIFAATETGDVALPTNAFPANTGDSDFGYNATPATTKAMNAAVTGTTGNGQPFNTMQPYLAVNYSIAVVGVFPSRN